MNIQSLIIRGLLLSELNSNLYDLNNLKSDEKDKASFAYGRWLIATHYIQDTIELLSGWDDTDYEGPFSPKHAETIIKVFCDMIDNVTVFSNTIRSIISELSCYDLYSWESVFHGLICGGHNTSFLFSEKVLSQLKVGVVRMTHKTKHKEHDTIERSVFCVYPDDAMDVLKELNSKTIHTVDYAMIMDDGARFVQYKDLDTPGDKLLSFAKSYREVKPVFPEGSKKVKFEKVES